MGSKDAKPHGPGESHVVQELRRRLAEPGPWPQRFRRLAEAIAATPIPRQDATPVPSCWHCEGLLDLCVDDDLQGRDLQTNICSAYCQRQPMVTDSDQAADNRSSV